MKNIIFLVVILLTIIYYPAVFSQDMIINQNCTDFNQIPSAWIDSAVSKLDIVYQHTSHGSQLTTGMEGLAIFKNDNRLTYQHGGQGSLDLHDGGCFHYGAEDLGYPDSVAWVSATRAYLVDHPNTNVVVWSWCGQVYFASPSYINNYLTLMSGLEADYPNISFVYMTGHVVVGESGNNHARNEQIRNFCIANNKILYDFAKIECYDPDGSFFGDRLCTDACYYDGDGDGNPWNDTTNWAIEWQDSHVQDVDWYDCVSAHSQPLNANLKAYAAWWLWARLAGWDGITTPQPEISLSETFLDFGLIEIGQQTNSEIAIYNNGMDTLIINQIQNNNSAFSHTFNNQDSLIFPGDSLTISIIFSPTNSASYSDTLYIYNNDQNVYVQLEGIGGQLLYPDIVLSDSVVNFGIIEVGQQANSDLVIYNIGLERLNINYIFNNNPLFSTNYNPADSLVLPGDSLEITITFSPSDTVFVLDTLHIYNNDQNTFAYLFGTGGQISTPEIMLSDTLKHFGVIQVGQQLNSDLSIYNVGFDTLNINNIQNSNPVFTTNFDPADSLILPGNNLVVAITFSPVDTSSVSDTLNIHNNDENCFVILTGKGELISNISEFEDLLPIEYAIRNIYPNPFNPTTTIEFDVPQNSSIRLIIYNSLGQEINSVIEQDMDAGRYNYTWNAERLASGIYYFRLVGKNFQQIKKAVLLK